MKIFLTCFLVWSLIQAPLWAQQSSNLSGTVKDSQSLPVSGAFVEIEGKALPGSRTAQTDGSGHFQFFNLKPGSYNVSASAPRLQRAVKQVDLNSREEGVLEFVLYPGPVTESITVTGIPDSYVSAEASTATKLSVPLADVPQSIQVINSKIIEDQRAIEIADAVRNVSGVTRASTDDAGEESNEISIRGFALNVGNNYLLDGFRYDGEEHSETANLEQIEVLKGPASVLYGRGEPGGVVNLVAKKPLERPYYSLELTGGSYSFFRPQFDVSGPLVSRKLYYRLNSVYQNADSFRQFVHGSRYFLAPVIVWRPRADTTVSVSGEYLRDSRTADFGLVSLARVPISTSYGEPFNHVYQQQRHFRYRVEHRFSNSWSVQNSYGAYLSNWDFLEVYQVGLAKDQRTVSREIANASFPREWQYSQTELTGVVQTGQIRHHVVLGFEAGYQKNRGKGPYGADYPSIDVYQPTHPYSIADAYRYLALGAGPDFTVFNTRSYTGTLSGYVQDQIDLSHRWKALIGARFERYRQETGVPVSRTKEDFAASPRVGLVYQPAGSVSLYTSFSRSFNPTSVSIVRFDAQPSTPTRGVEYEVGIKGTSLHGRLSSTLALYHLEKQNVLTADPGHPGYSIQTGTQRSKGVELDVIGKPHAGVNVLASYSFSQAQITDDHRFPIGNLLPNAARHSGSVWATYELSEGRAKGLGIGAGLWATSARYGDLLNTILLPGYARLDATVYYSFGSGEKTNYRFSVNCKNLLDRTYYETATSFGQYIWPGAPITVIAALKITRR